MMNTNIARIVKLVQAVTAPRYSVTKLCEERRVNEASL